jgi:hypothetical protein
MTAPRSRVKAETWCSSLSSCARQRPEPLTDGELTFIASYPRELSLLYPGLLS